MTVIDNWNVFFPQSKYGFESRQKSASSIWGKIILTWSSDPFLIVIYYIKWVSTFGHLVDCVFRSLRFIFFPDIKLRHHSILCIIYPWIIWRTPFVLQPAEVVEEEVPATRGSEDEPKAKKVKWTNKTRTLVLSSRGIGHRGRHLLQDVQSMMPHSKSDSKMQKKESLFSVNEIAEMKNCDKCLLFEGRKGKDLFMWLANVARGPSVKFEVGRKILLYLLLIFIHLSLL